jgi:hypothetical protein
LRRAQRQLEGEPECAEQGYVACGETERALGEGRVGQAEDHAIRAVDPGRRFGVPELIALGTAWQGLCRLAAGDTGQGTRLLDEAMATTDIDEQRALYKQVQQLVNEDIVVGWYSKSYLSTAALPQVRGIDPELGRWSLDMYSEIWLDE